jgi:hypothetical protein
MPLTRADDARTAAGASTAGPTTRRPWGYAVVVALLAAIAWDMIFKPGL